jgi:enoyl-CoA hydratase/carnithine racemase
VTLQREHDLSAALTYAFEDGIATIAIDDGKANVMSVSMLRALDAALDRAAADKAVVVLRGRLSPSAPGTPSRWAPFSC